MPKVKGKYHPRWKNGRTVRHKGKLSYVLVLKPNHPRSMSGYVYEHIIVAEKALGKSLPKRAVIHHVDNDGTNNTNSNLVICQDSNYHKLIHKREVALKACGNANWRKCVYCKIWEKPENIYVYKNRSSACHNKCSALQTRKSRLKKGAPL